MKITKSRLKQIIKEELSGALSETSGFSKDVIPRADSPYFKDWADTFASDYRDPEELWMRIKRKHEEDTAEKLQYIQIWMGYLLEAGVPEQNIRDLVQAKIKLLAQGKPGMGGTDLEDLFDKFGTERRGVDDKGSQATMWKIWDSMDALTLGIPGERKYNIPRSNLPGLGWPPMDDAAGNDIENMLLLSHGALSKAKEEWERSKKEST